MFCWRAETSSWVEPFPLEQNFSFGAELLSPWTSSSVGFYKLYNTQSTIEREGTFWWKGLFPNSSDKGKEMGCLPLGSAGEGTACPCVMV